MNLNKAIKIKKNLKYALVLSGGGARALVHVGVLCALEEGGYPPPSLIAGTSMGAIVGGLYASGISGTEIRRLMMEEADMANFMESSAFKMEGRVGKILQTGQAIRHAATRSGVDPGEKVLRLLERLSKNINIQDCKIPFLCNAVDLCAGQEVIFRSGSLAGAIRASMSFPFVFEPVIEGGRCFVDGGVADNLPVKSARKAAKEFGIKHILAVDCRRWRSIPSDSLKTGLSVVMRCFDAMIHLMEAGEGETAGANLLIHASDKTATFDFSRKAELMKLGEAAASESKDELDAFFSSGLKGALSRRKNKSCGLKIEDYYKSGQVYN